MRNRIDIIIKSWNAVKYTEMAVASIRQKTKIPYRITVVDNASSAQNLFRLRLIKGINLIEHEKNLGPAWAAITGYEKTHSKYFVLMDNDVVVSNGWLNKLLEYMEKDNELGIVSPLRYSDLWKYPGSDKSSRTVWEEIRDKSGLNPKEALEEYLGAYTIEQFAGQLVRENKLKNEYLVSPPGFVSSSCLLLNRDILEIVGGVARIFFEEYGGEDVDMCWRVGNAGYKILRSKRVYIHHFGHSSVRENSLDINELLKRSNIKLHKIWNERVMKKQHELLRDNSLVSLEKKYPFISLFNKINRGLDGKIF